MPETEVGCRRSLNWSYGVEEERREEGRDGDGDTTLQTSALQRRNGDVPEDTEGQRKHVEAM